MIVLCAIFLSVLLLSDNWLLLIPCIAAWAYALILRTAPIHFHTNWILLMPLLFLSILLSHHVPVSKIIILLVLDTLLIGRGMQDSKQSFFLTGYGVFLPLLYAHFEWRKTKYAFYLTLMVLAMYPMIGLAEKIQRNDRRIMGLFARSLKVKHDNRLEGFVA